MSKSIDSGSPSNLDSDELALLLRLGNKLVAELDLDAVLSLVAEVACKVIHADTLVVPIIGFDKSTFTYRAASGKHAELIQDQTFHIDEGTCGWVLKHQRPLLFGEGCDFEIDTNSRWERGMASSLLVPLICRGEIIGGLSAMGKQDGEAFNLRDLTVLTLFANQASIAIDNARLFQDMSAKETRLRTLIETLPDLVWLKDPEGVYLACNPKFERFFGAKESEILGKTDYDFFDKDLADFFREKDKAAMATGGLSVNEEEITYADDGHRELLETIKTSMFDANHRLVGVLSVGRNITERKDAEIALLESEQQIRDLLYSTAEAIYGLDLHGKCIFANPACVNMLGYQDIDELIGCDMHDQIHHKRPDGSPYPVDECPIFNAFITGDGTHVDTEVLWRADGSSFPAEYWSYPIHRDGAVVGAVVTFLDITERRQAEERIQTLSQAIEQSPVSVVITDPEANIQYVNRTFEQVSGYSSAEIIGQNTRTMKSGITSKETYHDLWQTISSGKAWQGEFQNRRKNGELFWEHAHIAPVLDRSGAISHYLAVKEDITLRKQQEEHILHQAHFDTLTDLPNRLLSLDRLSQLLSEAQRSSKRVAVLFLDLDDFKKINDTLGHDTGDKLLIEAASRLNSVVRNGDTVGRLGGDEFIALLGGLTDAIDARQVVENLLERFRNAFKINNRELILTASVGIAVYPDDGDTPSELLRNADSAMYHSKEQGRNTYSYFTDAMNRDVSRRLLLEEQMHGALNRGEFRLCYQPQVNIASRSVFGVEALLRWNNPALGEVSPTEFIPIAEQTGLIVPIGEYVLSEALSMAAKWQQIRGQGFVTAVNLSPRQFRDPNLVSFIKKSLLQSGVAGKSLELEITEGVLMSGNVYIERALESLSTIGVGIAMDDFGTGYSSLSYLRSYPFNILKIDRSFVNDITVDKADLELVNAAIAMAHGLGLKVVAEGVETEEQLALLATQGCEFAQGYLFGKPVSAEQTTEILNTKKT